MWNTVCGEITPRGGLPAWEAVTSDYRNALSARGWETETKSRFQYDHIKSALTPRSPMLITKLDTRRHNPHPEFAQHIDQLHGKKKVCTVRTVLPPEPSPRHTMDSTSYQSTFNNKTGHVPRILYHRSDFEKQAVGIVPTNNLPENKITEEMMLPIGISTDTYEIPSVTSPHKYIQRKRRVAAPSKEEGVFYGTTHANIKPVRDYRIPEKLGITNLTGQEFTRRKFVAPPQSTFVVKSFDGAPPPIEGNSEISPFLRVPNII